MIQFVFCWVLGISVIPLAWANAIPAGDLEYFMPNSTGFRMQHGFETILVQPFGYDGFRVRAWPYRPPTGNEISFIYDPPLEGFENGKAHGMNFDTAFNGNRTMAIRNGNIIVRTSGWGGNPGGYRLAFYRVEKNESETLLTNEYAPLKSINPRYYRWPGPGRYGFIWNMASEGRMEFGPLRNKFTADLATVVDYVIVAAPPGDYDTLQQRLSALTGRAPPPPQFSLGFIQSKLRYENQTEVELLAQRFKDLNIPVSLIVIDYQSWAHQGDWQLDPRLWPDVESMTEKVKDLTGAEMMASLWPSVADNSENYLELIANGFLSATRSGPGTTDSWNGSYIRNIDSTNPAAREFLWKTLKRNYYEKGIKNFWIDQADGGALGEAYENNGQSSYVESIPFTLPNTLYAVGSQFGAGKLYPWAHQQAIEEGFRNVTETKMGTECKHISLSRSGYIGSQRFCSMIWSGDTTSVWDVQVASGLSAAATGWGWWTMDAGGFQADPTVPWSANIDTPEYRELYVRWFQWATFLPFMRTHTGRSIMRPLYMDFERTDPHIVEMTRKNTNATTQQYMFGPKLLVTPITTPNVTEWYVSTNYHFSGFGYVCTVYSPKGESRPGTFGSSRLQLGSAMSNPYWA
ncbi:CAZyme family GH31 [Paecilomyces variotii]|nr:CAZyme family GH31 [Paecilomyces variotii]